MKFIILALLYLFSHLLISCEGDCRDEEIEKVIWVTYEKAYEKDTLVKYSIPNIINEYIRNINQISHAVTIWNLNESYSNKFAVIFNYGYLDSVSGITEMRSFTTDTVEIPRLSTYTFTYYSQGGYAYNFNNSVKVIQIPKHIVIHRKEDSLQLEKYSANSCKENIEALKQKYYSITELYKLKKSNR